MLRKSLVLFITGLLILSCVVCVSAEEFDPLKTGAISVTLTEQYEKTPLVGAELRLYHIATVGINTDGQLNYIYTGTFARAGVPLDDPDLIPKLEDFISTHTVPTTKLYTDTEGTARCEDLPLGLYLIRHYQQKLSSAMGKNVELRR